MLTGPQYERLAEAAPTARAIVDTDRAIAAVIDRKVCPLHVARPGGQLRELLNDRRALTKRADQIWGRPLRNDGTVRA